MSHIHSVPRATSAQHLATGGVEPLQLTQFKQSLGGSYQQQLDQVRPPAPIEPLQLVQKQAAAEETGAEPTSDVSVEDLQATEEVTPPAEVPAEVTDDLDARIEQRLREYAESWENIPVRLPDGTVVHVRPPYIINLRERRDQAQATRAEIDEERGDNAIEELIERAEAHADEIGGSLTLGKSRQEDIQFLLEDAVRNGLVEPNAEAMRDFLNDLGVGVDCSGYVSRAYNMLIEELGYPEEPLNVSNSGSRSFRGRSTEDADFVRVRSGAELTPGCSMFVDRPTGIDHIRIVISVTPHENGDVELTTGESSGSADGPLSSTWIWPAGGDTSDVMRLTEGHQDDPSAYLDSDGEACQQGQAGCERVDTEVTFGRWNPNTGSDGE